MVNRRALRAGLPKCGAHVGESVVSLFAEFVSADDRVEAVGLTSSGKTDVCQFLVGGVRAKEERPVCCGALLAVNSGGVAVCEVSLFEVSRWHGERVAVVEL